MLWNNVETKPYGSYPLAWDLKLLEMLNGGAWNGTTYEGRTIFESAPAGERMLGWRPEAVPFASISMDQGAGSFSVHDEDGTVAHLPLHRVRTVYKDGVVIWQRPGRPAGD